MGEIRISSAVQAFLIALYGVTGLTSLSYEILWIKLLSLQFGVSIFGVVVAVAAFMIGLGAGSLFGAWVKNAVRAPLQLFALLELTIATTTTITVGSFHYVSDGLNMLAPMLTIYQWYAVQFILTGMLLMVPALMMGMGFPLLLKALQAGPTTLGLVYGVNTCGAALGALLPLLLLPTLGWQKAMLLMACVSASVGVSVYILTKYSKSATPKTSPVAPSRHHPVTSIRGLSRSVKLNSFIAYAGIGAAALMLEIAWTRLFGMLFLRTEYVIAVILAVFLIGTAIGSMLARSIPPVIAHFVLPVAACGSTLLSLWLVPYLAQWVDYKNTDSLAEVLLQQGGIIVLLTLPVTFVLGAWLPLLTAKLGTDTANEGATLYGANALGAGVGALMAGFVLTPIVGTTGIVVLSALLFLLLGMTWCPSKRIWWAVPLALAGALPVTAMPAVAKLLPDLYHDSVDLFKYEDAVSITHVIEKPDGNRLLLADLQRMDASSDPASVVSQKNQSRLPLLLHPNPHSALLLGLGTGISATGAIPFPDLEISAVEISEGAIIAARDWFNSVNEQTTKRVTVFRDDARHFLLQTRQQYDVIIGDLFHPDLVGRSALLSVQQFRRAYARLSDQGVFVQWLALNQFDVESLTIILRSFQRVFPDARLFVDAFRLAMVGTKGRELSASALLTNLARMDDSRRQEASAGEGEWTWLGRYWGKLNFTQGEVQNEWAPKIEYSLPKSRFNGDLDLAKLLDFMLRQRPHVQEAARQLEIPLADFPSFERAYIATELGHRSWLALLQDRSSEGQRLLQLAFKANPVDRWISSAVVDGALETFSLKPPKAMNEKQFLLMVLKIRPDHPEALKRLWRLALKENDLGEAHRLRSELLKIDPLDRSLQQGG